MDYDRNDALLHWLFRQTQGDAWFRPNEENISSGVALRVSDGACSTFDVQPELSKIYSSSVFFSIYYGNAGIPSVSVRKCISRAIRDRRRRPQPSRCSQGPQCRSTRRAR